MFSHALSSLKIWWKTYSPALLSSFKLTMEGNMSPQHSSILQILMAFFIDSHVLIPLNRMVFLRGNTDTSQRLA